MDPERFDALTERLARVVPRRAALRGLAAAAAGLLTARFTALDTEAKKKKKGKGKKRCAKTGQPCGGTAGKTCCGNTTCLNGRCACGPAQKSCQNRCINKDACCTNKDCGGKGACTKSGACTCPKNKKACRGGCIGKEQCCTDKDCGGGGICKANGQCACPEGLTRCGGACADTDTDADNCGDCGVKCAGTCAGGVCDVTVTAADLHGWVFYNDQIDVPIDPAFVAGPGTPERGSGSAQLTIVAATDGQMLSANTLNSVPLSAFRRVRFAEYTTSSITLSLQLGIDYDGDGAHSGRLVHTPYWTNTVHANEWQTFDIFEDSGKGWWFSEGVGRDEGQCQRDDLCTWQDVLALYPHIRINPVGQDEVGGAGLGFVGLKLGSGNTNRVVYCDYFEIEVAGHGHTIYDFEP
ncbi:MAG: hypothetical protein IT337_16045 [Thermomicrobiales bacterium]|nr:hypothetical protein [Thermomicrobiales bacterium]